jgi:hypothetical protein
LGAFWRTAVQSPKYRSGWRGAANAGPGTSGVAGVACLLAEALQTLFFEVHDGADDGEATPPFVELVVIGVDALCVSHIGMFGR